MRATARKLFKCGIVLLLAAIVAATLAILVVMSRASVETTAHGAPTRLRLHLPGGRDLAVPVYVASGRQVLIPGFLDGPIVRRRPDGNCSATWFCAARPNRSPLPASALSLPIQSPRTPPPLPPS